MDADCFNAEGQWRSNAADVAFAVRAYEAGIDNHVTLPTLCNYMQEAAGSI